MTTNRETTPPTPNAGEWITHDGGPNPAPGQMVEWENAAGIRSVFLSDDVAGLGKPLGVNTPIVRYRLATPSPARQDTPAGMREDIIQWQTDQSEWFQANVIEIVTEYATWRDTQTTPEARGLEVAEEWLAMADKAPAKRGQVIRYVPICTGEINALRSVITAARQALSPSQSGGE